MDYFKLPNSIFDFNLNATEISVAAVLFSSATFKSNSKHCLFATVKQATVAKKLGIKCTSTVSHAIDRLVDVGIVLTVKRNKKRNGYLGTHTYGLPLVNTKYSKVPRALFKCHLRPVQLRMALYLNKCIDAKLQSCWNSYNDIANRLHLSRSSVINTIRQLVQAGIIICRKVKKSNGSFSDNHYAIGKFFNKKPKIRKKRRLPVLAVPTTHIIISLIKHLIYLNNTTLCSTCQDLFKNYLGARFKEDCNFYFFTRGSPKNSSSIYITHRYSHRKKN